MHVRGVVWLGIFPDQAAFDPMVSFLSGVIGLRLLGADDEVTQLVTERRDVVEVFRPHARYDFATTGPVPGFFVDDVPGAVRELQEAGVELLGETGTWRDHAWRHFRFPDGTVWEVTSGSSYRPEARAMGLPWVGLRTAAFADVVTFARDVMGLATHQEKELAVVLATSGGDQVEVFAEDEPGHLFLPEAPVVALEVPDVDAVRPRLVEAGCELLGGTERRAEDGALGQHFRAPDGQVYEVLGRPR